MLNCRIIDEETREAAAVDPVEPEKILSVAKDNGADLKMVLTTHHHWYDLFDLIGQSQPYDAGLERNIEGRLPKSKLFDGRLGQSVLLFISL